MTHLLTPHPLYTWEKTHGFIRHWFITGFFRSAILGNGDPDFFDPKHSTQWETDHLTPIGGETCIPDVSSSINGCGFTWLPVQGDEFEQQLNLSKMQHCYPPLKSALGKTSPTPGEWYALCMLESDTNQRVKLKFSVHDGTRLFHNGELVYDSHRWCRLIYDEITLELTLTKGRNTLLFKQDRLQMVARIVDSRGNAPKGLHQLAGNDEPQRIATSEYSLKKFANTLSITNPFTGTTPHELDQWQREFRPVYKRSFGQSPPTTVINTSTIKHIDTHAGDGYTKHRLRLPTEGHCDFECCVLIPDDNRRNGKCVITPHGHVNLYKHILGESLAPKPGWHNLGQSDANYNECLAKAGFVTAAFSQRGFDERNDSSDSHACNQLSRMAQVIGLRLPRLHIEDIFRVADAMATFEDVDISRLGLAGLSGGATISWIAGAYSDRFKAVAPYCGTMRATHWINTGGCGMQALPDIYPTGDTGEILSLIAPRALLLGQGRLDPTFNIIQTKSIYDDAKRAWDAAGVPEKLEYVEFEGGHQFHVPSAIRFFETHL